MEAHALARKLGSSLHTTGIDPKRDLATVSDWWNSAVSNLPPYPLVESGMLHAEPEVRAFGSIGR